MNDRKPKVHGATMPGFIDLCAAAAVALVAAKFALGIETGVAAPDDESPLYSIMARVDAERGPVAAGQLKIGGIKVSQGDTGVVEFFTDAQGVARVPLSLSRPKAAPRRPALLAHQMPYDGVSWNGSEVVLGGLRPSARYKMEVALWTRAFGEGSPARMKLFTQQGPTLDCAEGCVAALGEPALKAFEGQGPAAAAENAVLAVAGEWRWLAVPFQLAGFLLVCGNSVRRLAHRGRVALGGESTASLRVRPPKV